MYISRLSVVYFINSSSLPSYMEDPSAASKPAAQVMRELTDVEIRFRDESAAEMNFKLSNFPYRKTLGDFDFDYQPSVDRAAIAELRTLRFLENGDNVLFIGSSGVGKAHLATGIGIEATSSHVSTYFIHFRDLVGRLKKAAAENREEYAVRNLNKYKLLIIDEIGYFPIDKTVAQLFFQLVAARYEKRSIVVTTNQPLSRWGGGVRRPGARQRDHRPPGAPFDDSENHGEVLQNQGQIRPSRRAGLAARTPRGSGWGAQEKRAPIKNKIRIKHKAPRTYKFRRPKTTK